MNLKEFIAPRPSPEDGVEIIIAKLGRLGIPYKPEIETWDALTDAEITLTGDYGGLTISVGQGYYTVTAGNSDGTSFWVVDGAGDLVREIREAKEKAAS